MTSILQEATEANDRAKYLHQVKAMQMLLNRKTQIEDAYKQKMAIYDLDEKAIEEGRLPSWYTNTISEVESTKY